MSSNTQPEKVAAKAEKVTAKAEEPKKGDTTKAPHLAIRIAIRGMKGRGTSVSKDYYSLASTFLESMVKHEIKRLCKKSKTKTVISPSHVSGDNLDVLRVGSTRPKVPKTVALLKSFLEFENVRRNPKTMEFEVVEFECNES